MATIKSYTDIEQSRKLAKILPLESADMHYYYDYDFNELESIPNITEEDDHFILFPKDVRCWSLAALLCVLPTIDDRNAEFCKDIRCNKWHVYYHGTATLSIIDTDRYDNLVDACYEMIL